MTSDSFPAFRNDQFHLEACNVSDDLANLPQASQLWCDIYYGCLVFRREQPLENNYDIYAITVAVDTEHEASCQTALSSTTGGDCILWAGSGRGCIG